MGSLDRVVLEEQKILSLWVLAPKWTLRSLTGCTAVGISASLGAITDPYPTLLLALCL